MAIDQRVYTRMTRAWFILVCLFPLSLAGVGGMTCSQTISALGDIIEVPVGGDFTMCLEMTPGEHYRNYTATPITYNFILNGNNAIIRCDCNTSLAPDNYDWFPFIFKDSGFVQISDVTFDGCQRPLQFREILNITLRNVTVHDFTPGGAVEISNSPLVTVDSCCFTNNTSQGIGTTPYSGNSGALAVGYSNTELPDRLLGQTPQIVIMNSRFVKNSALAMGKFQYTFAKVLRKRVYNQRGGGIAVYFGTPNYSGTVLIYQCVFDGNTANSAGGGVYMFLTGENNSHTVDIQRSDISRNFSPDGGGIELTFDTSVSFETPNRITINNSTFEENRGKYGGGCKFIQVNSQGNLNSITIKNSSFSGNVAQVGSALYFQSRYVVTDIAAAKRIFVEDCFFLRNEANRGVVFVIQNTVALRGLSIFRDNIGPSIRVLSSLLSVSGDVWFVNNRRHPEGFSGALYFSSFGQLLLHSGTNMTFINNTGTEGACIVAKRQTITAGFTQQLYNPQCFLVYEDPRVPPPDWEVILRFRGNRAVVGPVVYVSNLDACQWFNASRPFFSLNRTLTWSFIDAMDNYVIHGTEPKDLPDYNIQTDIFKLQIDNRMVWSSPGDPVEVKVVALDQLGHETSAFLDISPDTSAQGNITFEPSIVQTVAGVGVIQFRYLSGERSGNTTVRLTPPFTVQQVVPGMLPLVKQECLPGYSPFGEECTCQETEEIALCLADRRGLLLANGLWGAPPDYSRTLVTHTCPPGYCQCSGRESQRSEGCLLLYTEPNHICQDKREGTLCGECKDGYGVGVLTTSCRKYSGDIPQYYWLIPIYLALFIPVLLLIVKLGVGIPSQLKGFLLYIQIADIAVRYLPESLRLQVDIVSYVNDPWKALDCIGSALALYFPYDFSFHEGLTPLESYGLRLFTPVIALIIVPIAMRIRYQSKSWTGVWTLILLMFAMSVETSVSLVFCPTFARTVDGQQFSSKVWFYDGSVECYTGVHLLLSIFAISLLIFLGLLVPIVALIVYHNKLSEKVTLLDRMERCSQALTDGIKQQYIWWPIVELLTRYVFVIAVVLSPGYKTLAVLMTVIVLSLHSFVHPYKSMVANHSKSFALLLLLIILALGNTTELVVTVEDEGSFTLAPLLYFPLAVAVVVFMALVGYNLWRRISPCVEQLKVKLDMPTTPNARKPRSFTVTLSNFRRNVFTTTSVSLDKDGHSVAVDGSTAL